MSGRRSKWQWWSAKDRVAVGQVIGGLKDQITKSANKRRTDLQAFRAMYLDKPHKRFEHWGFHRARTSRYNLIQGAVDATHAQIVSSRPRPKVVTIGQDHHAQRKAVLRQRWIDGEYYRTDAYEMLSEMCLDALIDGTGVLKVSAEDGRNVIDRVWSGDLWTDPREERYGRVRTLYQLHAIDRDVLAAEYDEYEVQISKMPGLTKEHDTFIDDDGDTRASWESPHQIAVLEAWRLPTSRTIPGRHVVVAHDLVLLDEEWTLDRFPFVFYPWATVPRRFWGQGMVERAVGMQSDLNELTEIIQEAYRIMVPQLWVDEAAAVQLDIDDEVGRINMCKPGASGVQGVVMALSPEVGTGLLQREAAIAERFLPVLGVDALGAKAEKPSGLNSGIAIQEYHDKTSQRFLPQGRRYEDCSPSLADLLFHFADELAKAGEDQTVTVYGKDIGLELIRYEDIKPADENEVFEVRVKPGSALPKDPAGKIQTVSDMKALGLPLDAQQVLELIEMPDTDAMADRLLAGRQLVMQAIDRCMMDEDDEPQPQANAYWNKPVALAEVTMAIQRALYQGAGQEVVARLTNLHGQIRGLPTLGPNGEPVPAADPAAAGPPADPMAAAPMGAAPPPMTPPPMPMPQGPLQ